jgi:pyridoxal phosphate enzyme (YggS family)
MTLSASDVDAIQDAHQSVLERIADACARVDRDPADVVLVAVSKEVEAGRLHHAVAAGIRTFGENRVQEGMAKRPQVEGDARGAGANDRAGLTWHLVGPLQSNKARKAVETFDVIQTIDSVDLARRIDAIVGTAGGVQRYPVLLQVNVDADPAKAGLHPPEVEPALAEIAALPHLAVEGLMTVGRLVDTAEAARPTFRALRELSERLRAAGTGLGPALSMGMTDDFEVAVEEGATIVRVGRAIFGERPHHHAPGEPEHSHRR